MSTPLSFGREAGKSVAEGSTEQVVSYVRGLIERGELRCGDRLPAERDLATHIGVSRPTVRAGLRALAAMGSCSRATARARTSLTDPRRSCRNP